MLKINSSKLALYLIEKFKSPWDRGHPGIDAEVNSHEHHYQYALMQIKNKTINGIGVEVFNKNILEIGCGHGGICIYMAMNGAKKVTGIDVSDEALHMAEFVKKQFEDGGYIKKGIVCFRKSQVEITEFKDEEFDLIIADNVLEHVESLEDTLKECKRILKKEGIIHVPNFPSIHSKFGPHLKYGAKIPWLHAFFTERAICQAVYDRAKKYPELKLFDYYGGLINNPTTFKEVRKYKDLNYITQQKFVDAVHLNDLKLVSIFTRRPILAKILFKAFPFLEKSRFNDVFSIGTRATITK